MTQNSTRGSMTEAPKMNTDTKNRGCFTLWKKIAKKADCFGHPEKFIYSPEKSNFVSVTLTVKDYPQFFEYLEKKTGNPTGKGGATTFVSSPWFITYGAALQPLEPNQPENVQVLWFYGLHSNEKGAYVKKAMNECTGEETLKEFLYWCGLEDKFDEIKAHSIAPYGYAVYHLAVYAENYDRPPRSYFCGLYKSCVHRTIRRTFRRRRVHGGNFGKNGYDGGL